MYHIKAVLPLALLGILLSLAGSYFLLYSSKHVPNLLIPYLPKFISTPAGCYYQDVVCFQAPCDPVLVCPTSTPAQSNAQKIINGCRVGGCSNQLCLESGKDGGVSTCEYAASYACYKNASCERQIDGKCGWTQTDELQKCLQSPPEL